MSDTTTRRGMRDELGDGFLGLLDSVRHSVEQAAWGQEVSGNLANDFYRWVGDGQDAVQPMHGAEQSQAGRVTPMEDRPSGLAGQGDGEWSDLKAAVDSSLDREEASKARRERDNDAARDKDEELEANRASQEATAGIEIDSGASRGPGLER